MKKVFNNSIFMFILGAVIFGSIGVIATTQIQANQITYTKNNVDTTLDIVLDDLYQEVSKDITDYLGTPVYYENYGTADLQRTVNQQVSKGKYLVLISEGQAWSYISEVNGTANTTADISCASNNCTLLKISGRFIRVPSSTAGRVVNNKYYLYYLEINIYHFPHTNF